MIRVLFCTIVILISLLFVNASRAAQLTIVCNTQYLGDNTDPRSANIHTWNTRHSYYCPQGIKDQIRLTFAGAYAASFPPQEYTRGQTMYVGVELDAPFPWQRDRLYGVGEIVAPPATYDNAGYNFRAVRDTRAFPSRLSADWLPVRQVPIGLTCGGVALCTIAPGGLTSTDPISVNQPPHSNVVVRQQIVNSAGISGPTTPTTDGSYQTWGSGLPNLTRANAASGSAYVSNGSGAQNMGPVLIMGVQNTPTPRATACLMGDSAGLGFAGEAPAYVTLQNGGTGFTADDVGLRLRNVDTNGSPNDGVPVTYRIMAVAKGRVTAVGTEFGGHYRPGNGSTIVSPHGIQTTSPIDAVHGTGVTVNIISYSRSSSVVTNPVTRAQGYLGDGFANAGIPYFAVIRSGDGVTSWLRSHEQRLKAMRMSGCADISIEFGANDLNAGYDAATVAARLQQLGFYLRTSLPNAHHFRLLELGPRTASSDHWSTTAQTPQGPEAERQKLNTWIAHNALPFSTPFNTTTVIQVNAANVYDPNGHFWRVADDGSPFWGTFDAGHFAEPAQRAAAAYIASRIPVILGH